MRGDGRLLLRGQIYWACFWANGKEVRESTKQTDEKEALKYLASRVRSVKNDAEGLAPFIPAKASRRSCRELLEAVKSNLESRGKLTAPNASNLKATIAAFGDVQARALTPTQVERYKIERTAAGDSKATVNRRLQFLRRAFKLAATDGLVARVPRIELLDESENVRDGFFETADFYRVHANLPEYLKGFAEFFFLTGMRPKEIKSLTWAHVAGGVVTLQRKNTKSKKDAREIPCTSPKLAAILAACKASRAAKNPDGTTRIPSESDFLFHRKGEPAAPIGDTRKSWATACKAGGVSRLLYDCRRTFARNQAAAGTPREVIKKIAGWRTDSMFERYRIVDTKDIAAAFERGEGVAAVAQ